MDGKPLVDQNQAYNWTQKAYLELQVENNSQSILQVGDADSWDSETRTLAYKVRNYYLYDLPMVGGIGTYWLTFLGAAVLAFALLLLRKREYTSSLQIFARRQSDPHLQDERRAGGQKK
ncbi:MAG: LPXTG cell wall anchor domain-containing protein [Lachnospiraceae bacterium]|nr:LPXTG cell wall anchor domain-containing protein [Lachnospiraceae bacterium]